MDSCSSYVLDIDAAPPPTIEYHYTVRQYCHNCGKYGHLNGIAAILYFRFILPYTTHYHKFTTHEKNIMVLKVLKIIAENVEFRKRT